MTTGEVPFVDKKGKKLKPILGFIIEAENWLHFLFVLPGHKAESLKPISGFNNEAQNGLQFSHFSAPFWGPEARQKCSPQPSRK